MPQAPSDPFRRVALAVLLASAIATKDSTTAQCEPWCQNTEAHIKYCKCSACSFAGKHAVGEACSFADVTRCESNKPDDLPYEACSSWCKATYADAHCEMCACRACDFCAAAFASRVACSSFAPPGRDVDYEKCALAAPALDPTAARPIHRSRLSRCLSDLPPHRAGATASAPRAIPTCTARSAAAAAAAGVRASRCVTSAVAAAPTALPSTPPSPRSTHTRTLPAPAAASPVSNPSSESLRDRAPSRRAARRAQPTRSPDCACEPTGGGDAHTLQCNGWCSNQNHCKQCKCAACSFCLAAHKVVPPLAPSAPAPARRTLTQTDPGLADRSPFAPHHALAHFRLQPPADKKKDKKDAKEAAKEAAHYLRPHPPPAPHPSPVSPDAPWPAYHAPARAAGGGAGGGEWAALPVLSGGAGAAAAAVLPALGRFAPPPPPPGPPPNAAARTTLAITAAALLALAAARVVSELSRRMRIRTK